MIYTFLIKILKRILTNSQKLKLEKFIKKFLAPPVYMVQNFYLNLLGLQIIRVCWINFLYKIKPFKSKISEQDQIYKELQENGIIVIKNFFSNDDFKFIKDQIEKLEKGSDSELFSLSDPPQGSEVVWITGKIYNNFHKTQQVYKIIDLNFKKYLPYIEKVLKKKINSSITYNYQHLSLPKDKKDLNDSNAHWHVDRMFPCIKSFIALDDCLTLDKGPFNYLYKSHKFNFNRIKNEYYNSTWWVKEKKKNPNKIIPQSFKYLTHTEEKPVFCEANSLIITNNMGFHKRGRLAPENSRKLIRVLFYDFQLPFYKSVLKKYLAKKRDEEKQKKLQKAS